MKKVTITASNGRGEEKVFVGQREVNKPDTLEEATSEYGADEVLEGFWASRVIYVQNQIRTGTGESTRTKVNTLVAEARKQKANGDSGLFDQLVALEIIKQ